MVPEIRLEAGSPIPLYRQLFLRLREMIVGGELRPGERLPPTRELAGRLGLNRTTVTAAYALLEAEGLIRGHVGRGSFVAGGSALTGLAWEKLLPPADPAAAQPPPAGPVAISFATSRPAEELFPLEDLRRTADEVLRSPEAPAILQLGSPAGYPPLREHLCAEARRRGLLRQRDEVVVTSGCQQGLDLLARVLVRPGDAVVVEDPVYPGLRNVFLRAGARVVGAPVGAGGVDLEELARLLDRFRPRLVAVTPDFQNPTGATLEAAARQSLLRMVRAAGAVLIENDIYGDLRYEGAPQPPLKQLDESGDTVLVSSFSKVGFPGLRVGWVIAPKPLVARLIEAKQAADLHTDQLSQAILLRFAQSGRLEAHRERVRAAGAERLRVLLAALRKHFPEGTFCSRPLGGMNLWVRLPAGLDAAALLPRALAQGVAYLPGAYFEVSRRDPCALRLCFAGLPAEKIRRGAEILGRLFEEELHEARGAGRYEPAPALV
ncbi:MAG: PLP-dependent aminotransferase family protein [Bryobacterales bacterium]|nr:PLP-dependent aminotransferase family protein [Bryobacteraceae bacterium]MDW8129620.1 PLP-dependent aminotransferase family protein [Bryobacterales bacterium]